MTNDEGMAKSECRISAASPCRLGANLSSLFDIRASSLVIPKLLPFSIFPISIKLAPGSTKLKCDLEPSARLLLTEQLPPCPRHFRRVPADLPCSYELGDLVRRYL